MLIRYLGIILLGFLLFSCGTPPAGWESADFSSGGEGEGEGEGDDGTQLFLADAALMTEGTGMNHTIHLQSGWCYNPEDGTVSDNTLDLTMSEGGSDYDITYTFTGGTVSAGTLASSCTYEGDLGADELDYELRFNSDFTSATFYYYYDGVWSDSQWGDISNTGSCE